MKFYTQSGSIYEINTDSRKIRRLSGNKNPTAHFTEDGEWLPYLQTVPDIPEVGSSVLIQWDEATWDKDNPDMVVVPMTKTSRVVKVEP